MALARASIVDCLKDKSTRKYSAADKELISPAAAFVTLTRNGELRGCIGTTAPQWPLYETVIRFAQAAAFEDYRFPKVSIDELKDIKIEISVLSDMARVKNAEAIEKGRHGVLVCSNGSSGLFLPQVWEHFENKEDFLSELCAQKAGLPPDAWKDGRVELYTFTVFAFTE